MRKSIIGLTVVLLVATQVYAQKYKTDREDDDLKGRVKKVVIETAKLTNENGSLKEVDRKISSVVTYDETGNRVRREAYYNGNLFETNDYSVIDGDKVVKSETIRSESGPPTVVAGPVAGVTTSSKRDPRYSYKFKYKYDAQGNRVEETWLHNDGSLWLRYVRVYDEKGNRVEESQFRADGSRGFKQTLTHDAQGNVIQSAWDYEGDRYDSRSSYTYEFDSKGNWIKRVGAKWVTKEGKSFFEPNEVRYRTITYY